MRPPLFLIVLATVCFPVCACESDQSDTGEPGASGTGGPVDWPMDEPDPAGGGEASNGTGSSGPAEFCGMPETACIEGRPVPCSQVDDTHCDECGCKDNLRCSVGEGCIERREFGESCLSHDDCKSGNCGKYTRTCRVAVGDACSTKNCDICATSGTTTYCTRPCEAEDCGPEFACIGKPSNGYLCEPRCSEQQRECPGECRQLADFISYSCSCEGACEFSYALRPVGAVCQWDAMCETGVCDGDDPINFTKDGVCAAK